MPINEEKFNWRGKKKGDAQRLEPGDERMLVKPPFLSLVQNYQWVRIIDDNTLELVTAVGSLSGGFKRPPKIIQKEEINTLPPYKPVGNASFLGSAKLRWEPSKKDKE